LAYSQQILLHLFTRFPFKPKVRLNDELNASVSNTISKGMKIVNSQAYSKMWDRNIISINRIEVIDSFKIF
jgi:hypothetical protein